MFISLIDIGMKTAKHSENRLQIKLLLYNWHYFKHMTSTMSRHQFQYRQSVTTSNSVVTILLTEIRCNTQENPAAYIHIIQGSVPIRNCKQLLINSILEKKFNISMILEQIPRITYKISFIKVMKRILSSELAAGAVWSTHKNVHIHYIHTQLLPEV